MVQMLGIWFSDKPNGDIAVALGSGAQIRQLPEEPGGALRALAPNLCDRLSEGRLQIRVSQINNGVSLAALRHECGYLRVVRQPDRWYTARRGEDECVQAHPDCDAGPRE